MVEYWFRRFAENIVGTSRRMALSVGKPIMNAVMAFSSVSTHFSEYDTLLPVLRSPFMEFSMHVATSFTTKSIAVCTMRSGSSLRPIVNLSSMCGTAR